MGSGKKEEEGPEQRRNRRIVNKSFISGLSKIKFPIKKIGNFQSLTKTLFLYSSLFYAIMSLNI